ncbi:MAG: hypothetical protein JHD06_07505 [Rhodoferax sp.]|nr:hypothetical protein [Rhodoferax sp.]
MIFAERFMTRLGGLLAGLSVQSANGFFGGEFWRLASDKKLSGKGFSAIALINASSRLRRISAVSLGLSVISPVASFLAIHISFTFREMPWANEWLGCDRW